MYLFGNTSTETWKNNANDFLRTSDQLPEDGQTLYRPCTYVVFDDDGDVDDDGSENGKEMTNDDEKSSYGKQRKWMRYHLHRNRNRHQH